MYVHLLPLVGAHLSAIKLLYCIVLYLATTMHNSAAPREYIANYGNYRSRARPALPRLELNVFVGN